MKLDLILTIFITAFLVYAAFYTMAEWASRGYCAENGMELEFMDLTFNARCKSGE